MEVLPRSTSGSIRPVHQRTTAVGLAYSASAIDLIAEVPGIVDYVEIPFEHLIHQPSAVDIRNHVPVILHCASLSIAGNSPPPPLMVDQLAYWIAETDTPWLGEHLAYVRSDGVWREIAEHIAFASASDLATMCTPSSGDLRAKPPYNVGYTVSPQLSEQILERVANATGSWQRKLGVPILLENGPIYFQMPGSTMSQFAFMQTLCARSSSQLLLLDLAHLVITCSNAQLDPLAAIQSLPLDRVVEIHLSGTKAQSGVLWDDHAEPISDVVFDLLKYVLRTSSPSAVTVEYNWDSQFPRRSLEKDINRVRQLVTDAEQAIS